MSKPAPTLVLADDHESLRRSLESFLAPRFDVVASVANGEELLKAVDRLAPRLALVDLDMPRLNGFDVMRELSRRGNPLPVVVISVTEDPDVVDRILELGARAFVPKSRLVSDLQPALEAALQDALPDRKPTEQRGPSA